MSKQASLLVMLKPDSAPINSCLNMVEALLFIFLPCCPLNNCGRAAYSSFKIDRLSSLFSCLFLACFRLLILLLLMGGNFHPNSGPIFPCSVCAGNVIWQGRSVQCCTYSKWVHQQCSRLSLSKFRTLSSSHSWSCPSLCPHS